MYNNVNAVLYDIKTDLLKVALKLSDHVLHDMLFWANFDHSRIFFVILCDKYECKQGNLHKPTSKVAAFPYTCLSELNSRISWFSLQHCS